MERESDSLGNKSDFGAQLGGGTSKGVKGDENTILLLIEADEDIEFNIALSLSMALFGLLYAEQSDVKNNYFKIEEYNPNAFQYINNYFDLEADEMPYLLESENSIEDVYFVDKNAECSMTLDIVYTFTYLLTTDEDEELPETFKSPHVQSKARKICDTYDELLGYKKAKAYWHRWFQ